MSWRRRFHQIFSQRSSAARFATFENDRFAAARDEMVRTQIERRGVVDPRVLAALRRVPRQLFVPPHAIDLSCDDRALPIGEGQTISQPYIVAVMSEALKLRGDERVLEIGTGSGYQAAILGELAREVHTLEVLPSHHTRAKALLADLSYRNVHCVLRDGAQGLFEFAPFDAILVAAAPNEVPPALFKQLKDGGRLVIPVGAKKQELVVYEMHSGTAAGRTLFPVQFVPLVSE